MQFLSDFVRIAEAYESDLAPEWREKAARELESRTQELQGAMKEVEVWKERAGSWKEKAKTAEESLKQVEVDSRLRFENLETEKRKLMASAADLKQGKGRPRLAPGSLFL